MQMARNLTDPFDGFLRDKRYLIMDRDTKYSNGFRAILEGANLSCVRLPPRSPNLSPHTERFTRSLKEECLWRMILFGEKSLRNAVGEFLSHYHSERNHQGLDNQLIDVGEEVSRVTGDVRCRQRLGGMLRCHYRAAA